MADDAHLPLAPPPPLPDIISRYLNGESLQEIAKDSRTASRTLYRWMLTDAGPEYDTIITNCLTNRIADADELLDNAQDSCQVARAREVAKFARMDFERRRPKLYGPKQEINTDNKITVIVQRSTPEQRPHTPLQVVGSGTGDELPVSPNTDEL